MKRSVQEIIELLVFGLIALLIGTGLLWLVGWMFDLVGVLFKFFAVLIWSLLRFIVPVAVVAAIVYALVRLVQGQRERANEQRDTSAARPATTADSAPAGTAGSEQPPASEAAKPQASEVWAPPQPSPPAGGTGSDTTDVDRPGDAMSDAPDETVSAPYETSSTRGMDFPAYDPEPASEFGTEIDYEGTGQEADTVEYDPSDFGEGAGQGDGEEPIDQPDERPYTAPAVQSDPAAPDFTEREWDEDADESEGTDENDRH